MKKNVLLTGANGFLGSHVARELLARGYAVRGLVRSRSRCATLDGLPIDLCEGDVLESASVARAVAGCDAVIHAAALAQVNPAQNPALWAINETGTEHVIQAALAENVRRFVYVGTANVFGFGSKARPGNETVPFAGQRYGSDYMESKLAATRAVERAVREQHLPAVLVHPTFMLGALDTKPTSGQMLMELHRGNVIGYPAGGKNFVHVRDVAIATVNALTMGRVGESYILGNENLSYREAFGQMAGIMDVKPPRWPIPPALAQLYGYGCDAWTQLTGHPTRLNSSMTAVANDGHYFSSQKAITELTLPQTPISEAISEAFDWFKQNKYVASTTGTTGRN